MIRNWATLGIFVFGIFHFLGMNSISHASVTPPRWNEAQVEQTIRYLDQSAYWAQVYADQEARLDSHFAKWSAAQDLMMLRDDVLRLGEAFSADSDSPEGSRFELRQVIQTYRFSARTLARACFSFSVTSQVRQIQRRIQELSFEYGEIFVDPYPAGGFPHCGWGGAFNL